MVKMNKFLFVSMLIFLTVAAVSDYYLYRNWEHNDEKIDTSWWLLYVNSLVATIVSVSMVVYLVAQRFCCKLVRELVDCLATLICVGPLIKAIYYASVGAYFVISTYLIQHVYRDDDQKHELKDEHPDLYRTMLIQIVGAGLLVIFTGLYILTSPCRWSGCCSKKSSPQKEPLNQMEQGVIQY